MVMSAPLPVVIVMRLQQMVMLRSVGMYVTVVHRMYVRAGAWRFGRGHALGGSLLAPVYTTDLVTGMIGVTVTLAVGAVIPEEGSSISKGRSAVQERGRLFVVG